MNHPNLSVEMNLPDYMWNYRRKTEDIEHFFDHTYNYINGGLIELLNNGRITELEYSQIYKLFT